MPRQPDPDAPWEDAKRRTWAEYAAVDSYEQAIGTYAQARDLAAVEELLPEEIGRLLDLPCGAGRMSRALAGRATAVFSADYSLRMLAQTSRRGPGPCIRCDGFRLPFASGSFDTALMLRLVFHYPDPLPLFREIARVLKPGGTFVFDSLNRWTSRHLAEALLRLGGRRRGGEALVFSAEGRIREAVTAAGLVPRDRRTAYLLPTRLYRHLPAPLCSAADVVERLTPRSRRVLSLWSARKPP